MPDISTESVRRDVGKGGRVFIRANLGSNQTNLTGNAWNKINLNSAGEDLGTNFDPSLFRFIAPITGLYEIIGAVEFNAVIADKRYAVGIYKNGASVREVSGHSSLAANLTVSCSDRVFLRANEYVELYAYPEVGGGVNTVGVLSGTKATTLIAKLLSLEGIRQ